MTDDEYLERLAEIRPKSGRRPEQLNQSRDVNIPAQLARGWAAGTLGLPGDIEGLGRAALNFSFGPGGVKVDPTPALPTSDFYREYLPGYDPAPAARAASGLGALAGGAGATGAVRGAGKAAGALGRVAGDVASAALTGPRPGSLAAQRGVIKMPGGNWLEGSIEGEVQRLRDALKATPKPTEHRMLQGFYRGYAGEYDAAKAAEDAGMVFVSPQRAAGEFYAQKRAKQTGTEPHLEMVLADPFAGFAYGHNIPIGPTNKKIDFTKARQLQPEHVQGVTKLYAEGGAVQQRGVTPLEEVMRDRLLRGLLPAPFAEGGGVGSETTEPDMSDGGKIIASATLH
jgi:hypothetical protein